MNYGYFYEQKKTKLYDRGDFGNVLLRADGVLSFGCHLFGAKGYFPLGFQRAAGFAALFYLREFLELYGSRKADSAQPFSLCHERAVGLSHGSQDHRRYAQGRDDLP